MDRRGHRHPAEAGHEVGDGHGAPRPGRPRSGARAGRSARPARPRPSPMTAQAAVTATESRTVFHNRSRVNWRKTRCDDRPTSRSGPPGPPGRASGRANRSGHRPAGAATTRPDAGTGPPPTGSRHAGSAVGHSHVSGSLPAGPVAAERWRWSRRPAGRWSTAPVAAAERFSCRAVVTPEPIGYS